MNLEYEITAMLQNKGATFVKFVDIADLPESQNKSFPRAILIGVSLTREYLKKITETTDYVKKMLRDKKVKEDEFHNKEIFTDGLADFTASYLIQKRFEAYSQSEENLDKTGAYNKTTNSTLLPHKVIASRAGMGWIGKHNLLITPEYGSAVSMCTVLTNAPLKTVLYAPEDPQCGSCTICEDICQLNAIKGTSWSLETSRDEIIDVYKCSPCIECLVRCPYTQKYVRGGGLKTGDG